MSSLSRRVDLGAVPLVFLEVNQFWRLAPRLPLQTVAMLLQPDGELCRLAGVERRVGQLEEVHPPHMALERNVVIDRAGVGRATQERVEFWGVMGETDVAEPRRLALGAALGIGDELVRIDQEPVALLAFLQQPIVPGSPVFVAEGFVITDGNETSPGCAWRASRHTPSGPSGAVGHGQW